MRLGAEVSRFEFLVGVQDWNFWRRSVVGKGRAISLTHTSSSYEFLRQCLGVITSL